MSKHKLLLLIIMSLIMLASFAGIGVSNINSGIGWLFAIVWFLHADSLYRTLLK